MKKISRIISFFVFLVTFFIVSNKNAYAINLTEYIAQPGFVPHDLSTGEHIHFDSADGSSPKGATVRQYKNSNYEQFILGSGWILRREDTSWAPLPGFGDAQCTSGGKAIYTLDPGCNVYGEGAAVTNDGANWAPNNAEVGATWQTQTHQIVTIHDTLTSGGGRNYCSVSNVGGYNNQAACNQSAGLALDKYYPPGAFTFCTGIKNEADLIVIRGVSGPGAGDVFYYMKGWGLVGFEAPGFEAGLMGPGATTTNCTGGGGGGNGQPPKPFSLEKVACNLTTDPEFHSLRPYPTSSCNPDIYQDVYMCGNDLIVKEGLRFSRANAYSCEPTATGSEICHFFVSSNSNISLGLDNTDLPILGNTELVPNSTNSGASGLSFVQRVNEYVSWYLNGISYRAEEKPQTISSGTDQEKQDAINTVINLAGPLKKLIPKDTQTLERNNEENRIPFGPSAVDGRHNQIVACGTPDNPQQCYVTPQNKLRITNLAYTNPDGQAFQYLPFSSTEDRTGLARADIYNDPGPCPTTPDPTGEGISCAHFDVATASRNVYFAHIDETKELGIMLQSMFKPKDEDDSGTAPLEDFNEQNNPGLTPYCELIESRRNPGDKLYGNLARDGSQPISGALNYTANFSCEFSVPTPEAVNACVALCNPVDLSCIDTCSHPIQECSREVAVPFRVQIAMPESHFLWEKFVAGSMSVFKRFFPQVGKNTPVEKIEDIPGEGRASYSSVNQGVSGGTLTESTTLAGDPNKGRPGSAAKVFFPHLGSIYDYFLKDIQKALLPKGFANNGGAPDPGQNPPPPPPATTVNCNTQAPEPTIPARYAGKIYTKAQLQSDINSGRRPFNDIVSLQNMLACWNDLVGRAISKGNDPALALAIWAEESWASNYPELEKYGRGDVADFGCTVGVSRRNYAAQSECFLNLRFAYASPSHTTAGLACRLDDDGCLTYRDYFLIFEGGRAACAANDFTTGQQFPNRIQEYYNVTSNGNSLNFAERLSCP